MDAERAQLLETIVGELLHIALQQQLEPDVRIALLQLGCQLHGIDADEVDTDAMHDIDDEVGTAAKVLSVEELTECYTAARNGDYDAGEEDDPFDD